MCNAISFLQCDHTASLDAFFELFWNSNTTYVTLLGCGCSQATIPVAETSHYWNIPQVKSDSMCILNNIYIYISLRLLLQQLQAF